MCFGMIIGTVIFQRVKVHILQLIFPILEL